MDIEEDAQNIVESLPDLYATVFDELDDDVEVSNPLRVGACEFTYMLVDNGEGVGASLVGGEAKLYDSSEIVGRLSAALISRESQSMVVSDKDSDDTSTDTTISECDLDFYSACATVDDEVHESGTVLFTADGRPGGPLRRHLGVAERGAFLYIVEVQLLPMHRKHDIGLDFVDGLLEWLRGRWTVAVLFPAGSPPVGRAANAVNKIARHFARLGFQQVGRYEPHLRYWCLHASKHTFGERKSKEEAGELVVAVHQKQVPMTLLDQELHDVCVSSMRGDTDAMSTGNRVSPTASVLCDLLERGADPSRARALHVCAANVDLASARELLELGAPVNSRDAHGNTAFHAAASHCGKHGMLAMISLLLSWGACMDAENEEGLTPLGCVHVARKQAKHLRKKIGLSKSGQSGQGCLRPYDQAIALLSNFVQQPERQPRVCVHTVSNS